MGPPKCSKCGKVGHTVAKCWTIGPDKPSSPPKRPPFARTSKSPPKSQTRSSPFRGYTPRCYTCNQLGHLARQCKLRQSTAAAEVQYDEYDDSQQEAAACFPRKTAPTYAPKQEISCRAHGKVECPECFNVPSSKHQCQALVAICQDCGQPPSYCRCLSVRKEMSKNASYRRYRRR